MLEFKGLAKRKLLIFSRIFCSSFFPKGKDWRVMVMQPIRSSGNLNDMTLIEKGAKDTFGTLLGQS